jgi:hypothetical protein
VADTLWCDDLFDLFFVILRPLVWPASSEPHHGLAAAMYCDIDKLLACEDRNVVEHSLVTIPNTTVSLPQPPPEPGALAFPLANRLLLVVVLPAD